MDRVTQATAIIRQRGQLTIPDEIRKLLSWLKPNAVVTVKITQKDRVIVQPHSDMIASSKDQWLKTWEAIQLARSFKGKRGNLSKFIAEDREGH